MDKRKIAFLLLTLVACVVQARKLKKELVLDTLMQQRIVKHYSDVLQKMVAEYDSTKVLPTEDVVNPYYYRLFVQGTLYKKPIQQAMAITWKPVLPGRKNQMLSLNKEKDTTLILNSEINKVLMNTYVHYPQLITLTETNLQKEGGIRDDIRQAIKYETKLSDKTAPMDLDADVGAVAVIAKKPNFWTFKGFTSFDFTQNYVSENWYKGGEDNYSMLGKLELRANYNNKQKLNWENFLEVKLGFRTNKSDKEHKLRTTDDLLRLTTTLGYKAAKSWDYTFRVQLNTQMYPSYRSNSNVVASDFMSPFNSVFSLGMRYTLSLKRFWCEANLSPISYNFRSVARDALAGQHGLKPKKTTYNHFGPNVTIKHNWTIWKNISWESRMYWFSNLDMTTIEWENTVRFKINKYLKTTMFIYPRIDDSSKNYKNKDTGKYFMLVENLSLGLEYSF